MRLCDPYHFYGVLWEFMTKWYATELSAPLHAITCHKFRQSINCHKFLWVAKFITEISKFYGKMYACELSVSHKLPYFAIRFL